MSTRDIDTALLGAPRTLTRDQVRDAVGASEDDARAIWTALGFPVVPPATPAFTTKDAEALRTVLELRDGRLVDFDTILAIARTMGQHLAALAEAQIDAFEDLSAGTPGSDMAEIAAGIAEEVMPALDQLVVHVWRRQFAAAAARKLAAVEQDGHRVVAVGFVDLVDFTRSSRTWNSSTLARTLDRFERETARRVADCGGRVVKILGDAVMYVIDDPADAVRIALQTVEAHDAGQELPQVRAGVALGPVLQRVGDVFGESVNIASRLTGEARPSSVLVDGELAQTLRESPDFRIRRLKRRSVRGYRALTPWVVTRPQ